MATKSYAFPDLDLPHIIQYFKQELPRLNVSHNDFTNPKSERWEQIYAAILEGLTDVSCQELQQLSMDGMEKLPYPELMEKILPLCMLTIYMKRVMIACGISDFNHQDILEPESKRLQRNMSAIIKFCFFRIDRIEFYQSIKEENAAHLKMRDASVKENMDIRSQINQIRSKNAMQDPAIKELEEKNNELHSLLTSLTDASANKKKMLGETNTRIAEKKAKIADIKARVAAAKEEGNRLSQQIVQSPERMKENMGRMAKQLEQLRITKEERKARLAEHKQMKEDLEQIQNFCDQALDFTSKIATEVDIHKEKQREIQVLKDRVVEKKEELHDLETQELQVNRLITSKQEKLAKMGLTQTNKKQSQENTLQLLQDEKEILSVKQTKSDEQKDAVFAEVRELTLLEDTDITQHNERMVHMKDKYASVLEQLEVYHSKLAEACTSIGALGKK